MYYWKILEDSFSFHTLLIKAGKENIICKLYFQFYMLVYDSTEGKFPIIKLK